MAVKLADKSANNRKDNVSATAAIKTVVIVSLGYNELDILFLFLFQFCENILHINNS